MTDPHDAAASIRVETVTIPTYGIGAPDRNPMFLEKRVYQGSSGVVYPHPVIDKIHDEKQDRQYTAVFLENRYIKVMVLPQIGGRVQMALDKTNGYHFVYYNRVIKPALVGLAGPWISGGIEFNWPQHHRPNTFGPVDWRIDEHEDGAKTLWCSEIDRMGRTKGMHGFTIRPDEAALDIHVQLYNRTPEPQTFLWWANPAVHVNEQYQSVFPQDVHAVMDHGKRDVSDFPIATGTYYKVDYSPGTDISRYVNIPVPTSYMAYHSDYDFVGCYDHGPRAGMLHVADHHVSPGKKQWTWGCGDFGRAWDRELTDEDGPYIELMCGAFTDNQPDFTWLMPGEEKSFTQRFMPYQRIGPAKNATRHAAVNLEIDGSEATIGVYVTRPQRDVRVQLVCGDQVLHEQVADLAPDQALVQRIDPGRAIAPQELTLIVCDSAGRELVTFTPRSNEGRQPPAPAQAAPLPPDIESNEQLYLAGLHLEQYRHATREPGPYYEEALRRDPTDIRNNNAMGLLLYRRGAFAVAEPHFRRAIETLTGRNPNPYDGEPHYNLGLCLKMQGRFNQAYDAFYKSTWSAAQQACGYFELARIAARRENFNQACDFAQCALDANGRHHQARHLLIAVLRRLGRFDEAHRLADQARQRDPLDFGSQYERSLLAVAQGQTESAAEHRDELLQYTRGDVHNHIELGLDYAHAGLFTEAMDALTMLDETGDPMASYYLGHFAQQAGRDEQAERHFTKAASLPPDYCFPNRLECIAALETAMQVNPGDARAPYYLGNFFYAHRHHERAIALWEQARTLDPDFPTVHRNLGLAYFNKRHDPDAALASFENAFERAPDDARVFFELDQLLRKRNVNPSARLARMEQYEHLVEQRDDLSIERITLLNLLGEHQRALDLLLARRFHPWEGGEGKTTGQYVQARLGLARAALRNDEHAKAVEHLAAAKQYPPNLGEGKLYGCRENHIDYTLGLAHAQAGETQLAKECFEQAAQGSSEPADAMYYNDQPPDMIFYQGLALQRLNRPDEAERIFRKLIEYGQTHLDDTVTMDYFAVSLPDFLVFDENLQARHATHCHYMMALGRLGLGEADQAAELLEQVLAERGDHPGAHVHRSMTQ